MEIKSCFMIAIFVAFAILHSGEALNCYDCLPTPGKFCETPTEEQKKNCGNVEFCTSCKATLSNETEVFFRTCNIFDIRQRTLVDGTEDVKVDYVDCNFCKTDLCNAGNANGINTITLGGLALLWATYFVFTDSY